MLNTTSPATETSAPKLNPSWMVLSARISFPGIAVSVREFHATVEKGGGSQTGSVKVTKRETMVEKANY